MISHKYKCIFIHIPRTGGSSIELAIKGRVWWTGNLQEKHMSASETRKYYGEKIWNNYFKFSFVRNPWDRIISLWKSQLYTKKCSLYNFLLNFRPAEHEYFSSNYCDILNEELDFIGYFENLQNDFEKICNQINLNKMKLPHFNQTKRKPYYIYYDDRTKSIVSYLYKNDIEHFNYNFDLSENSINNNYHKKKLTKYILVFKIFRIFHEMDRKIIFFSKKIKNYFKKWIKKYQQ